jgi:hypothetical protein
MTGYRIKFRQCGLLPRRSKANGSGHHERTLLPLTGHTLMPRVARPVLWPDQLTVVRWPGYQRIP